MFGNSFRQFEEDPFFREHHERMRQTFGMFNGFDQPFDPFMSPFALPGPQQRDTNRSNDRLDDQRGGRDRRDRMDLAPRDMFGGMFANMNSMFGNMGQQFQRAADDPNSYSYSQSSVMSYSSDGRGEPKYYQAHKTTKQAPGGVKETQHAVRDSETGLNRMAIGHHIGDRGRVMERSQNKRTGEEERKQDFINMEEEDVNRFNQEWEERTRSRTHTLSDRQRERPRHRAIEEPIQRRHGQRRERAERERERRHEEHDRSRRVRVQSCPVNRDTPQDPAWTKPSDVHK